MAYHAPSAAPSATPPQLSSRLRRARCAAATVTSPTTSLPAWLEARGAPPALVAPAPGGGLVTLRAVAAGEVLAELPEASAVTTADVLAHPLVGPLSEGRGELVGLALWLLAERAAGPASAWCVPAGAPRLC